MSYPYPAPYPPPYQFQPVPRPPSTSTKGAKVLTFIGIAVLVVAIATGIGGGVLVSSGVHDFSSNLEQINTKVDTEAIAAIAPGQTETVTLSASTSYALWVGTTDASTVHNGSRPVVTGPDGRSVTVSPTTYDVTSESGSLDGWRFTSQAAGDYTITAAQDGPALQLLPGIDLDALVSVGTGAVRAVGGGLLVATAVGIGAVGLGLGIGGAAWWSSRAKNARRAAAAGQPF